MDLLIEQALGSDDRDIAKKEKLAAFDDPFKTLDRDK